MPLDCCILRLICRLAVCFATLATFDSLYVQYISFIFSPYLPYFFVFQALRLMARTYRAGKVEAYLPIVEIGESLMFEDEDDVIVFLEHCGIDVVLFFIPVNSI